MQPSQEHTGHAPSRLSGVPMYHVQDHRVGSPTAHVVQQAQPSYTSYAIPHSNTAALPAMQHQHQHQSQPSSAYVLPALTQALAKLHDHTYERFEHVEGSIKTVLDNIAAAEERARSETSQLAQWIERSHILQIKAVQSVLGRVQKLDGLIGGVSEPQPDVSVKDRLQRLEYALQELLEKTVDPQAPPAVSDRIDKAVNTSPHLVARDLVDKGIDPHLPNAEKTYIDTGVDAPVVRFMHASIDACAAMIDASTDALTPGKANAEVDALRPLYSDTAVHAHSAVHVDTDVGFPQRDSRSRSLSYVHMDLAAFGKAVPVQTRFPSSPFASEPMAPAAWTESSDTASPSADSNNTPRLKAENLPVSSGALPEHRAIEDDDRKEEGTSAAQREADSSDPDPDELGLFNPIDGSPQSEGVATPIALPVITHAPSSASSKSVLSSASPSASALTSPAPVSTLDAPSRSSTVSAVSSSTVAAGSTAARGTPSSLSKTLAPSSSPRLRLPLPRNLKSMPPSPALSTLSSLSSLSSLAGSQPSSSAPASVSSPSIQLASIPPPESQPPERDDSPEIQIIEPPPTHGRAKRRGKSGSTLKKPPAERPRKRRKTDGDALESVKVEQTKRRGRPPRHSTGAPRAGGRAVPSAAMADGRALEPEGETPPCRWPEKARNGEMQREFVQCDNCDAWYHFGCVGLAAGDPRLDPDASFHCPPCESSRQQRVRRHGMDIRNPGCGRPDCDHKGQAEETHEYFVERIIGRKPHGVTNDEPPAEFLWLVKWDGYKAVAATWTLPIHLGDCAGFIDDFENAALIEGHDLEDSYATVLLNEAAAVGWW
ncbi:predicted protein [Sparassis crispa]|uniref:Chromo domain-containing protein n=1 Tax=Sparassis crispa TaxID=139825 RepID=A0A401GP42_9APHY|nr:predicted protein [Sparassis crispa]GBE83988.1 predicted protein [Sparassis crispa]